MYHYVAESSCCAKFYKNRLIHFGLANKGSFSFFFLTKTQTNFIHLANRSQIWNELKDLKLKTRGSKCRCAFRGLDDG